MYVHLTLFCDDLAYKLTYDRSVDFPLPLLNPHFDYGLFLLGLGVADLQKSLTDVGLPENVFDWTRSHRTADQEADIARDMSPAATIRLRNRDTWVISSIFGHNLCRHNL